MQAGLFEIVIFISVFQLGLFNTFLLAKVKSNRSNLWLSVFFISQVIAMLDSVFSVSQHTYFSESFPSVINLGLAFRFLWAPSYYLYIGSLLGHRYSFKTIILHSLPFLFLIILYIFGLFLPNWSYTDLIKQYRTIGTITLYTQLLIYNGLCLFYVHKKNNMPSRLSPGINKWAKFFVYSYLLGCCLNIVPGLFQLFGLLPSDKPLFYYVGHFYFFVFFNIVFYYALIKPTLFNQSEINLPKYAQNACENDLLDGIHLKLKNYLTDEKAYLKSGLTLSELASLLKVKPRALSQAINKNEQLNYSDYINSWRINYAKSLLKNESSTYRTILEVLYESGFNSKTSFNQAFKKHTGLTPMVYKKQFQ